MIIGLTGYKQSGKDTTANILVEEFGFEKMAFGDALRQMAAAINPWLYVAGDGEGGNFYRYRQLLDELGYENAKQIETVRQFLQTLGTEAVRNVLGEQTWIHAIDNRIGTKQNIVIADCRFPNESDYVTKTKGGFLWRIVRGQQTNTDMHDSERLIDKLDPFLVIPNNTSIEDLRYHVRCALETCKLQKV